MNYPTGVELHNGKIRISFTYRGVRCREVLQGWVITSANVRKAGNLRAVIVSEIQLGTFEYAARFPESKALKKFSSVKKVTGFGELCDIYMEAKRFEISAATYDSLSSVVTTLRRVVGDATLINEIQHSDLLRYRNELLTGEVVHPIHLSLNKSGRAASTVNGMMSTFSTILKLAYRSNFIKHAPYEGLKWLKKSKSVPDPLLPSEYSAFMEALSRNRFGVILWTTAIHTGLRHGELAALAWEDIDLEKRLININHSVPYYPRRAETTKCEFAVSLPKTEAGIRTVPMMEPVYNAFMEEYEYQKENGFSTVTLDGMEGFIFTNRFGNLHNPQAVNRTIKRIRENYNAEEILKAKKEKREPIIIPHFSCHHLRHTFCTRFCENETNIKVIQAVMGHANIETTMDIYAEVTDMKKTEAIEKLSHNLDIF